MEIGITGGRGFLGFHLAEACRKADHQVIFLDRDAFADPEKLASQVGICRKIVHFAGLSRHEDGRYLYDTNLALARALDSALKRHPVPLFFASTTHWAKDLEYHRSKRDARALFERSGRYPVVTLRMANVFGPGSRPFYNSVVSTFCRLAAEHRCPEVIQDVELELLYVDELTARLMELLQDPAPVTGPVEIAATYRIRLPELWKKLERWSRVPPENPADFDRKLYTTLRSYFSGGSAF